jgi:uncharacterized SAM-binding protein YcdF (DUF218 family)/glycosyltransferase involved in cell wall biosynthesis
MPSHDIICISTIDWDFIWQGHQEIMSTLAAEGHRVLFVENTGVRTPAIRDLSRVGRRLRNFWRGTNGFRQERDNLFIYSPIVVPFPYSRVSRWINRYTMLRALRRWMNAVRFGRPIVWTFLPTPLALDLIQAVDPKLCVYYCIDDLASSSHEARRIVESERTLFRKADLVFVTSEKLRARAAIDSGAVHVFPFGVSLQRFEAARESGAAVPADVSDLPRPIIGYVGGLHQWVDVDLLADAARRLPQATFVLIGPEQADMSVLRALPNVRLLGARPHDQVPHYVKAFDVGIVPYRLSEYTAHVYPTKLNEYLVMGIPVVTTDLPEIRRFNREHGEIVEVAADAGAFVDALTRSFGREARTSERRELRIEVARRNAWSSRIARMSELVEEALAMRAAERDAWDVRLRRLYRGARRRTAQAVIAIVAAYLLVFQTTLVWWLAKPLQRTAPPELAEAIVVFAGGVGESGQAGGGYQERVKAAVDLYHAHYAQHLVLSSGFRFVFHEAEVMRDLAVANGVPADAIELEQRAANTHDNVLFTREILVRHGWRKILLVSSPYHMRRAMLTWRGSAPDIIVIPAPVPQSLFYLHERGPNLDQVRGIMQEYLAIVAYWWRGWI